MLALLVTKIRRRFWRNLCRFQPNLFSFERASASPLLKTAIFAWFKIADPLGLKQFERGLFFGNI